MTKEELKKEAEEYALNQWEGQIPWGVIQKAYYDSAEPREKRIAELEKENAELKHTTATLRQEKDNVSMHAKAMEVVAKTRSDQLTKATEIIKKLIEAIHIWDCKNLEEVEAEAEQFLKDNEVEKCGQ